LPSARAQIEKDQVQAVEIIQFLFGKAGDNRAEQAHARLPRGMGRAGIP